MNPIELEDKIQQIVESAGFHLLKARWTPMRGRQQLNVVADAEDHNITIDECAHLSRMISDLLDSYPHQFPDYRLEVSSPGLSHPLEEWQFRKNVGRSVEIRWMENEVFKSYRGKLISVDFPEITVESSEGLIRFNVERIKQVNVLPGI